MALRLCRFLRQAEEGIKNRLLLTLASPAECIFHKKPVDSVTVPGVEGAFTLTNNHSQVVSQLGPGVVTVRGAGGEPKEYFVSDGFAMLKAASDGSGCCTAEVVGVEVVPTDAIDKDKATQVLSSVMSGPKESEWDKLKVLLSQKLLSAAIKAAR
uniref:ATP synthase F1 complex delta/epsilon subunit N-terminal domain-containing protein n=1 Tax=Chromera velia CCMP2878 TaxID=1169474 RepID=A0A0G4GE93_9ALVE|mmetsp:Transcript_32191/g.63846  ORF Transcript_32191/g.63846 Transcript_32191/m.63846 type:complete len:155 (-) Transcript_32191:482-946(-)|eukprot:Cvel_21479.t1-p1 / transcript=Cvel_21479.t1 / gene=Cvel_21479 / organism=Chromera_velia_CCMP2878 / gene_product=ATP synthase subunit delta, mitochondrial, putative / transcript_product=ATP synthase subunit delta, mitochondrial, putative / location=Cvel_scaffold2017:13631-14092(+) / protein_length=154 / sequence_SO=supercontig / SO=protein_coding / is_pseudo=false